MLFFAAPAFAQEKTAANAPAVQFITKGELRREIPEKSANLRKTIYLILRADKAGLAQFAALQYRDLWQKNPESAVLKTEYAFSYVIAIYTSPLGKPSAEQKRFTATLNQYFAEADLCREEALAALPKSPEVILMTAWGYLYRQPGPKCISLSEKAVALAPDWSLAHYRLAYSLMTYYGLRKLPNSPQGLARALAELKQAESLKPTIKHENILYDYLHIYDALKQYDKSLVYIDQILEANARNNGGKIERDCVMKWKADDEAKLKAAGAKTASSKP